MEHSSQTEGLHLYIQEKIGEYCPGGSMAIHMIAHGYSYSQVGEMLGVTKARSFEIVKNVCMRIGHFEYEFDERLDQIYANFFRAKISQWGLYYPKVRMNRDDFLSGTNSGKRRKGAEVAVRTTMSPKI